MKIDKNKINIPFCIGVVFLICVTIIEFCYILKLNNGLFIYTLDDPYIHMALAEKIKLWHYGINTNEFSAPSSSILWPFILAPFSFYEYSPLLINIICAIATVFVISKIFELSLNTGDKRINNLFSSIIIILFVLATNIVGLIFTGMEHSLQVLLVAVIVYGIITEAKDEKIKWWFIVAIILAPLIRYECVAISISAVVYVLIRGYYKQAISITVLLVAFLIGFSVFLVSLGLDPFPTSVVVKSSVVETGGAIHSVITNLKRSLTNRQGFVLLFGMLALLAYAFSGKNLKKRQIALVSVGAIFMHFIAGQYDSGNRYEIYIVLFMMLVILYIFAPLINKFTVSNKKLDVNATFVTIVITIGFTILIGAPYINGLFALPIASNNIYEQQYQMSRFATYYNKPVAVNDLGCVSYKNPNYVLDLWGLGSKKSLELRISNNTLDWMKIQCSKSSVGLVMIYEDWFGQEYPDGWIKIGELHLGKQQFTVAQTNVSFYATNRDAYPEIINKLHLFVKTLPADVNFIFEEEAGMK